KGAHYGYNCSPQVVIIPNPKPCNNETIDELPQTLPSFDPTCYSGDGNSFTYDTKSNIVDDSPNVLNPPPQLPKYSYEFCGNDTYYGHDCPPQQKNEEEEKQIAKEQAAKARYWKISICYDDDEDCSIAITPKELDNYLSMGDEHLDTIPTMKSNEFIKSSVENLSQAQIDSLLDEFTGELTLLKSIPPGINETDCDPEEEIRLIKKLFDSFMEEIDLSFTSDDPMPLHIEEDDYDSERGILILEELVCNNSLSLPENELFHFDIPSSPRPPAKPPDGNSGILNVKVMGDISENNVPMPRIMLTQPTLVPNQEKSPNLLSHPVHKASHPSTECPMMIYEGNTPILDVPFLHFYPP
nr:hypothetical protein [Tanacetum cinerariifolium]